MVPFLKRVKIPQQKCYHFRRRSNIVYKKWNHFKKWSKIVNENGTILVRNRSKFLNKMVPFQAEKGQNISPKIVPFHKTVKNPRQKRYHFSQKRVIISRQKGTISDKGQKSSTKMVPFQSEKGHNFSTKRYHFREGSKIVNKNGTISEKDQKSSKKWYHF